MQKKKKISKWSRYFIILLATSIFGCKGVDNKTPISSNKKSETDFKAYLEPLEGTWKGRILTYSDPRGQVDETPQPKDFTPKLIVARPTKTESITNITETYTNDGELTQRVRIVEQGRGKEIYTHHGIRKVEDGIIKSKVNKLKGVDNRTGYADKDGNFIWIREQQNPKLLEFYKHIKKDNKIRVIGWGYYGEDDLTKAPRIWFFGDIKKVAASN